MKFLELKDCPHCGTRVLPTGDGLCPNCRRSIADVPGVRVEMPGDDFTQEKEQGPKKDAKCPIRGLINPAGTINCDCGYNFESGLGGVKRYKKTFVLAVIIVSGVVGWILFPLATAFGVGVAAVIDPSPGIDPTILAIGYYRVHSVSHGIVGAILGVLIALWGSWCKKI